MNQKTATKNRRVIWLVLDSLGIGAAPDAERFGDMGADTLGHIADVYHDNSGEALHLPNLAALGLVRAHCESTGRSAPLAPQNAPHLGAWGYASELSSGKDTPSGHWEMAGVPVLFEWGYFPRGDNCFPAQLLSDLVQQAKLPGVLGNCHASGTTIIDELGPEHMRSGAPIVYTSADSVFQIAAHEETFGLERLLETCHVARRLVDEYQIGRVIARPFIGPGPGHFQRTGNRRDLAVPPPASTVLDKLAAAGGEVVSVGKISDIFAGQGITRAVKATGIEALLEATITELEQAPARSIVFTNFVDFDSSFGHRRDTLGYADALAQLDCRLPKLLKRLAPDDLLLLTADHGCDPTFPGSDHTRENVPVLAYGGGLVPRSLGQRSSFADMGQTVAAFLGLEPMDYGESFLQVGP